MFNILAFKFDSYFLMLPKLKFVDWTKIWIILSIEKIPKHCLIEYDYWTLYFIGISPISKAVGEEAITIA